MTRFTFLAVALVFGGVVASTPSARAQAPASPPQQMDHQPSTAQAPMMMSDAQMMSMHQKMMADMKAMDVKLDALITKMNAAKGAAKVDAIAEAFTAMVQQHKTMRDGMMQMDGQMMMQMHGPATMPMGGAK
ncbi:MAG: hypothetical protein ABIW19_06930 [Vicinamibacterales bacterium]